MKRKIYVPESLFNKVVGLHTSNFISKLTPAHVSSREFYEIVKTLFCEVKRKGGK